MEYDENWNYMDFVTIFFFYFWLLRSKKLLHQKNSNENKFVIAIYSFRINPLNQRIEIQIRQKPFYHLFIFTWNLIKFLTCVQYFYIFWKFGQWIKTQRNGLMDELKGRNCFHFHFWGKWRNGWTQGKQLCRQLLDKSGVMDEFGEFH